MEINIDKLNLQIKQILSNTLMLWMRMTIMNCYLVRLLTILSLKLLQDIILQIVNVVMKNVVRILNSFQSIQNKSFFSRLAKDGENAL
jgi:hypothetical protein